MRLAPSFIFVLTLSKVCSGLPIPDETKSKSMFSVWKKYLPLIGTLGLLGGLAGIVFLGTKADEAYKAAHAVEDAQKSVEYMSLPLQQQSYLDMRKASIGQDLTPEERKLLAEQDKQWGWPSMEMPDTSSLDRKSRKTLQSAYRKLQTEVNKASETQKQLNHVSQELNAAQFQAAVTAATEWKQALDQVKAKSTEEIVASK
jgi:hypothetical protein